ncbi:hypothetical protein P9112_008063 [Eukaryota sp. TZLM1-RC]
MDIDYYELGLPPVSAVVSSIFDKNGSFSSLYPKVSQPTTNTKPQVKSPPTVKRTVKKSSPRFSTINPPRQALCNTKKSTKQEPKPHQVPPKLKPRIRHPPSNPCRPPCSTQSTQVTPKPQPRVKPKPIKRAVNQQTASKSITSFSSSSSCSFHKHSPRYNTTQTSPPAKPSPRNAVIQSQPTVHSRETQSSPTEEEKKVFKETGVGNGGSPQDELESFTQSSSNQSNEASLIVNPNPNPQPSTPGLSSSELEEDKYGYLLIDQYQQDQQGLKEDQREGQKGEFAQFQGEEDQNDDVASEEEIKSEHETTSEVSRDKFANVIDVSADDSDHDSQSEGQNDDVIPCVLTGQPKSMYSEPQLMVIFDLLQGIFGPSKAQYLLRFGHLNFISRNEIVSIIIKIYFEKIGINCPENFNEIESIKNDPSQLLSDENEPNIHTASSVQSIIKQEVVVEPKDLPTEILSDRSADEKLSRSNESEAQIHTVNTEENFKDKEVESERESQNVHEIKHEDERFEVSHSVSSDQSNPKSSDKSPNQSVCSIKSDSTRLSSQKDEKGSPTETDSNIQTSINDPNKTDSTRDWGYPSTEEAISNQQISTGNYGSISQEDSDQSRHFPNYSASFQSQSASSLSCSSGQLAFHRSEGEVVASEGEVFDHISDGEVVERSDGEVVDGRSDGEVLGLTTVSEGELRVF